MRCLYSVFPHILVCVSRLLNLARASPGVTYNLSHTPSFTHNFNTHHLSPHYLSHTILSHTIFHHTIFHTQLCHTQSLTTPSFTHNFVTHHLSHTRFHTQLCHTPSFTTQSFTHNFVTHHLSPHHLWQAWHLVTSTIRFAWQAWHLHHWAGFGVDRWRRGTLCARRGARRHPPSLRVAGVALGNIYLRFAWQAWHLWHWAGFGCALGRG